MASNHKEISHTRINRKKFEENRSKIDWSVKGLKQCPYSEAVKCVMTEPCLGCETHAEYLEGIDADTKSL